MQLNYGDFERILNIGIGLSTEKNRNHLLESILENGMSITHCDASTLYLYENGMLSFRIMKTISMNISKGEDGEAIDMPPVPLTEQNVSTYSALHRTIVNIPDVYDSTRFDFSGPKKYDALTGYHTQSLLVIPVENNEGDLIGVLQLLNAQDKDNKVIPFDKEYEIIVRSLASLAAIELTNLQYVDEIKEQLHSFVEALATAIDERTPYNGSHTRKVAEYSSLLAEYINQKYEAGECEEAFEEEREEKLVLAALLHDIGKMIIPLSVMNRATRLDADITKVEDRFALLKAYYRIDQLEGIMTEEEYQEKKKYLDEALAFIHRIDGLGFLDDDNYARVQEIASHAYLRRSGDKLPYLTEREQECLSIRKGTLTEGDRKEMESHVVMTEKILSKVHFNKNYEKVPGWAASHHELLDGSGYPRHLKAEQLDLETRILTVADVYDALTATDRPYKKPMPKEKAIGILRSMAQEGKVESRLVEWLNEALEQEKRRNL